ncbi:MAG: hypothetical protein IKF09_01575 [Clostridiales bacterium]|nr:hypothetical protein [Clostridiales bacterium]
MAFGIKQIKVTTKENYSMQSLYERIKDEQFSVGKPELVKNGFAWVIAFPAVDRNNQCQITQGWFKGEEGNKFTVLKAERAGTENMLKNAALDSLTNGWSSVNKVFGKNSKLVEKQVEDTAKEFNALGL